MEYKIANEIIGTMAETIKRGIELFFTTNIGIFLIITAAIMILGLVVISSQIGTITNNQKKLKKILEEQRDIQKEILISLKIRDEQQYQQNNNYNSLNNINKPQR